MKSRVTRKRFGSSNENRASHFASPSGGEIICIYANCVGVNCITWHSEMTVVRLCMVLCHIWIESVVKAIKLTVFPAG